MSWLLGRVSDSACWEFTRRGAAGGDPGGDGGRSSPLGGNWSGRTCFLFDTPPSNGPKEQQELKIEEN